MRRLGRVPARALAGLGRGRGASRFTRDDLRTPFSKTVVGPLAVKERQGGEAAREPERGVDVDVDVAVVVDESSSLRRLAGRRMTPPSWPPSSFMGTLVWPWVSAGAVSPLRAGLRASWWGSRARRRGRRACLVPFRESRLLPRRSQQGDDPAQRQTSIYRPDRAAADESPRC